MTAEAMGDFLMRLRCKKQIQKMPKRPSHPVTVHSHRSLRFCGGVFVALAGLALSAAQAQSTTYTLGTSALLVGPAAGSNSVVLGVTPATAAWTASANTNWLHLGPAYQSGTGSTNVIFSYDANAGATRSGTLTIGDQTLTVTQAGSTYVAAGQVTTLVPFSAEPPFTLGPSGLAVDGVGNVYTVYFEYIPGPGWIQEWTVANNTVTTLASLNLAFASGVAVDGAGNVYIAANGEIEKWTAGKSNFTTIVSSGLTSPEGVAVDSSGNVYIANGGNEVINGAIKEWTAANSNVTTLVSSGLYHFAGVAVDGAGNVYIADNLSNTIKEWTVANSNVTTLVASGLSGPRSVAVDGAGNVYIADGSTVSIWSAANKRVSTLVSSGLDGSQEVAVDGAGNVYIAANPSSAVGELPHAFVDPTPRLEGLAAGNDALPVVLPATENLLPPFAPSSDRSWLTITSVTNGVVSFSFTANPGSARTAHITLLGQSIPITQGLIGTPPNLSGAQMPGRGVLQFAFTNVPGASFTVVSTTNLSLPLSDWTVAGAATNTAPGAFQFTSQPTTNDPQRFYGVRSP
jgi:hypothetical protein